MKELTDEEIAAIMLNSDRVGWEKGIDVADAEHERTIEKLKEDTNDK